MSQICMLQFYDVVGIILTSDLLIYLFSGSSLRGYVGVYSNDLCMDVKLGTYSAERYKTLL